MIQMIRREDAIIVEMNDRPCETTENYEATVQALTLAGRQAVRVVVDCSRVEWMAGSFLSALLRAHKIVGARRGDFVLCGLQSLPREIFSITQLDTFFEICETRAEALWVAWPVPDPTRVVVSEA